MSSPPTSCPLKKFDLPSLPPLSHISFHSSHAVRRLTHPVLPFDSPFCVRSSVNCAACRSLPFSTKPTLVVLAWPDWLHGCAQGGNNNTYCHDSELNWFNWGQAAQDESGYARFFRHLVNFRCAHCNIDAWLAAACIANASLLDNRYPSPEQNLLVILSTGQHGQHTYMVNLYGTMHMQRSGLWWQALCPPVSAEV